MPQHYETIVDAYQTLDAFEAKHPQAMAPAGFVAADICKMFNDGRAAIEASLTLVGLIPGYGPKIVALLRIPLTIADGVCNDKGSSEVAKQ